MALDFPSSPIDGQISGNYVYSASSGAWKSRPQLQQTTTQSPTTPTSPNIGDIWIDTTDGSSFTYMDDGTSKQWVELISSGIPSTPVAVTNGGTGSSVGVGLSPTGSVMQYAAATAPSGWLICDGSNVSRTTYASLFSVIGTTYGTGDGSTTFSIPNLQGKIPVGKNSGTFSTLGASGGVESITLTATNLPSHTHSGTTGNQSADHTHTFSGTTSTNGNHRHSGGASGSYVVPNGSFYGLATSDNTGYAGDHSHTYSGTTSGMSGSHTHSFTTDGGSGLNATAITNLQPYLVMNYIIKT